MKTRKTFRFVMVYVLWFLTAAFSLFVLFRIERTMNLAWPLLGGDRWSLRAADRFYLVGAGIMWLSYVVLTEELYRRSISDRQTRKQRASFRDSDNEEREKLRFLKSLGIDVLIRRFLLTVSIPLLLLIVNHILYRLAYARL